MNKIFSGVIIFVFAFTTAGFADGNTEQKKGGIFEQIQQFRENIETGRDPLKDTLENVNQMKEQYQIESTGTDRQTAQLLKKLRNPFIPQLPQPKAVQETPSDQTTRVEVPEMPNSDQVPQAEITKPNFVISGLVWNTKRPQAIVNGEVVSIGDIVENWTIVDITNEGIEVTFQNKNFKIKPADNKGERPNEN